MTGISRHFGTNLAEQPFRVLCDTNMSTTMTSCMHLCSSEWVISTSKQDRPCALMSANVRDASDVSREFHTGDYVLNKQQQIFSIVFQSFISQEIAVI